MPFDLWSLTSHFILLRVLSPMPMVCYFLDTNNPNFQLHPSTDGPNPDFDPCIKIPRPTQQSKIYPPLIFPLQLACLMVVILGLPHLPTSWLYGALQVSFKQTASLHTPVSHLSGFLIFLSKSHSSLCFLVHPLFSLPCFNLTFYCMCSPSNAFHSRDMSLARYEFSKVPGLTLD